MTEVSRFEAESKLFDALMLLRNPDNMEKIRDRIVGDFWNPDFRRAPFEECLTFKQLASIQYDTLIKKRSLDADKMMALADAVRKAVNEPNTVKSSSTSNSKASSGASSNRPSLIWKKAEAFSNVCASLFCLGIVSAINQMGHDHPYVRVLRRIFNDLDPQNFIAVWFLALNRPKDALSLGIASSEKEVIDLASKTASTIRVMIAEESPELQLHWSTALSGAGAYLETLATPYLTSNVSSNFYMELSKVLVWALGGRAVVIEDTPLKDHFSLSPMTAGSVVKALSSGKRSKEDLRETFSLPFPFFDLNTLIEHVSSSKPKKAQGNIKIVSNRSKQKRK